MTTVHPSARPGEQRHRRRSVHAVHGEVLRDQVSVGEEVVLLQVDARGRVDGVEDLPQSLTSLGPGCMVHHVLGDEIVEHVGSRACWRRNSSSITALGALTGRGFPSTRRHNPERRELRWQRASRDARARANASIRSSRSSDCDSRRVARVDEPARTFAGNSIHNGAVAWVTRPRRSCRHRASRARGAATPGCG